jgi:hypothetical protein
MTAEGPAMLWMFHREGEYLSCEVRTCLDRQGYELVVKYPHTNVIEWFNDAPDVERRWSEIRRRLDRDGWQDMYDPKALQPERSSPR